MVPSPRIHSENRNFFLLLDGSISTLPLIICIHKMIFCCCFFPFWMIPPKSSSPFSPLRRPPPQHLHRRSPLPCQIPKSSPSLINSNPSSPFPTNPSHKHTEKLTPKNSHVLPGEVEGASGRKSKKVMRKMKKVKESERNNNKILSRSVNNATPLVTLHCLQIFINAIINLG